MNSSSTKHNDFRAVLRNLMMGNKAFMVVLLMCIAMAIASPVFMRPSNLLNITRQICVSTLLSVGFTIVLSSKHMDLSVGTLLGLCGIVLAKLIRDAGGAVPNCNNTNADIGDAMRRIERGNYHHIQGGSVCCYVGNAVNTVIQRQRGACQG